MLPHITNAEAGRNHYDPAFKSIYEVAFTLPDALRAQFAQDEAILTQHVQSVSGLDSLYKGPETGSQKFFGTTKTFINPTLDDTSAEITVKFALSLRNGVDNYIYKLFRAWKNLNYNLATGERHLEADVLADWMRIRVANQVGEVWHDVVLKDVKLSGSVVLTSDLDYTSNDALELEVKFKSDWWDETSA